MPGDASEVTVAGPGPAVAVGAPVRLPVAVLAVLAALVAALLAVWGTTVLDAPRLPTGPPRDPPAAPPAQVTLTLTDLEVRLDEFQVTLAGPPFTCRKADSAPAPAFPSYVSCFFPVHESYAEPGVDWVASTGVAVLDGSVVKPDLPGTAKAAFQALYAMSYTDADHPRIVKAAPDPIRLTVPRDSYATYGANVEVHRKGLATPYDRVVVAVLKLRSGQHVVFFSDFPHDGSRKAIEAVAASVGSITLA